MLPTAPETAARPNVRSPLAAVQQLPDIAWLGLVAAAYFLAARLGIALTVQPEGLALIWPASGIALAAVLLSAGRRRWLTLATIFVVNTLSNLSASMALWPTLGFSLVNMLEPALGAWIMRLFGRTRLNFARVADVFVLAAVATFGNAVTASLGAAVPALIFGSPYLDAWSVWWAADGMGMLLVTPAIIAWLSRPEALRPAPQRWSEALVLAGTLAAFAWVYGRQSASLELQNLGQYIAVPVLIWAALRFSPRSVSLLLLVFGLLSIWGVAQGGGPFEPASFEIKARLVSHQLYLSVLAFSGLSLAAVSAEQRRAERSVIQSEERYRSLFENMQEGYAYCQMLFKNGRPQDFVYIDVNPKFEELTGLKDVVGKPVSQVIPGIRQSDEPLFEIYGRVVQSGVPEKFEFYLQALKMWFAISVYRPHAEHFVAVFDVIDERKRTEAGLRASEKNLKRSQEVAHVGHWTWETAANRVSWSDEMYRIFGLQPQGFDGDLDHIVRSTIHPEDLERVMQMNAAVIQEQQAAETEYRVIWPDGSVRHVWTLPADQVVDAAGKIVLLSGVVQDITERRLNEERLKTALAEKEALLRELYHRTKNNMQVISALLSMQEARIQDPFALAALQETKNRIQSMSLVHEMLYQAQDLSRIDLGAYVGELANLLIDSYQVEPGQVAVKIDAQPVQVLIDSAIPCGLILNELISNALKHAFKFPLPAGGQGEITIQVAQDADGWISLQVADNGGGLPEGFNPRTAAGMGLKTVFALAEQQLRGQVEYASRPGFRCQVRFRDSLYQARV